MASSTWRRKWSIELPEEAEVVLARTEAKYGTYTGDVSSPSSEQNRAIGAAINSTMEVTQQSWQTPPASGPAQAAYAGASPTAMGSAVRPQSSGPIYNPLLTDADPTRGQQYPHVLATPTQPQVQSRHKPSRSMQARPIGNSPGGMFGGVEQLLRDSSDWAYRDQAQLATGFGNWNTLDAVDPSNNWVSESNGDGSAAFPIQQQQQVPPVTQSTAVAPQFSMTNGNRTNNAASANDVMTWMNGNPNPYTNMMNYDEEEWYR